MVSHGLLSLPFFSDPAIRYWQWKYGTLPINVDVNMLQLSSGGTDWTLRPGPSLDMAGGKRIAPKSGQQKRGRGVRGLRKEKEKEKEKEVEKEVAQSSRGGGGGGGSGGLDGNEQTEKENQAYEQGGRAGANITEMKQATAARGFEKSIFAHPSSSSETGFGVSEAGKLGTFKIFILSLFFSILLDHNRLLDGKA